MSDERVDKRRRNDKAAWSGDAHAADGTLISLVERDAGRGVVRCRWTRPDGKRPWVTVSAVNIRNKDGSLAQRQVSVAKSKATALYDAWKNPAPVAVVVAPFSLEESLELYLDPLRGPKMRPQTRKAARRCRAQVAAMKNKHGQALIDEQMPAAAWNLEHCQIIWRTDLARQVALDKAHAHDPDHKAGGGRRTSEYRVGVFCSAVSHARNSGKIEVDQGRVVETWRTQLTDEWVAATEVARPPFQPRYSVAETRLVEARLQEADPRLRLRYLLGADLRPIQVVRARRGDIVLEGGAFGLGVLTIRGNGHKAGAIVDLSSEMRAEWDLAVGPTGYLRNLEAAHVAGKLPDYYLFPLGKRVYAGSEEPAVPVRRALRGHMDPGSMNDLWRDLEELAGVVHVDGRGMYGMRRLSTDVADDVSDDEDTKDALGGWAPGGGTRRKLYVAKERRERAAKAAHARAKVRAVLRGDDDRV